MKKLLMLVFAVVVMSVGLFACGQKEKEQEYKLGMGVVVSLDSSKKGTAQVDATVATVVTDKDGKIVVCRIDVAQNKASIADGTYTAPTDLRTKMEKGADYGMGGSPYAPDNNGDGKVEEWDVQAKAFEAYVVGKTGAEVAKLELQEVNSHQISTDEALLSAGCTIQITDFMAAVAKACADEQGFTFTAKAGSFTLGVAATSYSDAASVSATAEAAGVSAVYTDFAAAVVADGKILASINDAIQPQVKFDATGEITEKVFKGTKRELKEEYGMGGKPYSPDNNGDGKVEEWYIQSAAFSKFVVGKTAAQVAALETKEANGHQISTDEELLAAGCTIQITSIKAVVAKACENAR